jgi:hypothetical protein
MCLGTFRETSEHAAITAELNRGPPGYERGVRFSVPLNLKEAGHSVSVHLARDKAY